MACRVDCIKNVILECISSADGSAVVDDSDTVMEAIDGGVTEMGGILKVHFTSMALLKETCMFARLQVLPASTQSLVFKVVNASGQASEYLMQSLFFRGIMFVMEKGLYTPHRFCRGGGKGQEWNEEGQDGREMSYLDIEELKRNSSPASEVSTVEKSFAGITCWYVNFLDEEAWVMKDDGEWITTGKNVPPEFPKFLL
ncbi:hypothetical protein SELMODRAFT_426204 [Selaginella moellendorffii]|uniref:Uncharacterized protein n=1 Tax=Selaginella moellendorffii TaxID=88036 RepID=D8SVN9_SELML|nr:hypothetical protein SELMODRAFT_426204 [Selaginella moellendorffii]